MALPTGWATMATTESHAADVTTFAVGWTWTGGETGVLGSGNATGTGLFGFMVYKNIAGPQVMGVDDNSHFSANVRYRVVVTNPATVTNHTLPRLAIELRALSYASSNKLPNIGSGFFGGLFGTATGSSNLTRPVVKGIQYEPENEKDPSIWIITYTVSPRIRTNVGRLTNGPEPTKPNIDEAPWTIGADVNIDFGTEDFVLGLGKYIASKTPAELNTALENNTYAGVFGATGGTFEMVCNSAGDPLESPPPMKVGTATIRISRAFETVPSGIAAKINSAREQVCSASVTANGVVFAAHTCKLSGATIANKRFKKQCDWLPRQLHPLGYTFAELGWVPPVDSGYVASDRAVNYTRNTLPAFIYVDYFEISLSVAQRDLGWGYALIDKGYRDINKRELSDFSAKQTYSAVLADGAEVDMSTGTSDKKVLRLYQVLTVGTDLSTLLAAMFA